MPLRLSERQREILEILSDDPHTSVSDISGSLNVSAVTVRNDLNTLAKSGFVIRTRGGAIPAFHPKILASQKSMVSEKNRIAKAAAELIQNGDKIMLVAGTTAALIVKYLLGKQDIHIVTNSTQILPYARINPSLHVTLVGGEFRPSAEAMVGPIALRELDKFHVKLAFAGTDGFSPETGVTSHLVELAEVVNKMVSRAQTSVLVADSSKYGKAGFAHILPLNSISKVITDDNLPNDAREVIKEQGLSLTIV